MKRVWIWVLAVAGLMMVGAVAWIWLSDVPGPPDKEVTSPAPPGEPPARLALPAPSVASAASDSAPRYPIQTGSEGAPIKDAAEVERTLDELFGRAAVTSFFQPRDFAHRFVATVDNLGRPQGSARLWPLNPAEGQFLVEDSGGAKVISAKNEARYARYVRLLASVDMGALASAYRRAYPLLQQTYGELGFPGRFFNDRLVQVIDQLLATPQLAGPAKVHLPALGGTIRPERPWVLYEFDDPGLQALSSGQKMLLRMGPLNEAAVKAKLAEFRRAITAEAPQR